MLAERDGLNDSSNNAMDHYKEVVGKGVFTDDDLSNIEKFSDLQLVEIAGLFIEKIYQAETTSVEKFIAYFSNHSNEALCSQNIMAQALDRYMKVGRPHTNLTEQLCRSIRLNNHAMITWIMSLLTPLNYSEVVD
jgi:hypothetical protein